MKEVVEKLLESGLKIFARVEGTVADSDRRSACTLEMSLYSLVTS